MTSHFNRDDQWQSLLARRFLDPFYERGGWGIERYPGEHPMQRLHVDITIRRGSETFHVDEKIIRGRRDGLPATKASLETMSCSNPGMETFGWIHPDEANSCTHLLICFADVADLDGLAWMRVKYLDCIWIPFAPLREWFWEQDQTRWELQDNDQSNHSLSRKVPIAEIEAAVAGVRRFGLGFELKIVRPAARLPTNAAGAIADGPDRVRDFIMRVAP